MSAPKIYTALVWAPGHWPIQVGPNGGRQVRAVAAVKSRAEFGRLLDVHGCHLSAIALREWAVTTGNESEVAAATSEPGVLFRATGDMAGVYVRAETRS